MTDQTVTATVAGQSACEALGRRLTSAADQIDALAEQAALDLGAANLRLATSCANLKATLARLRQEGCDLLADLAGFCGDLEDGLESAPPVVPADLVRQLTDAPWELAEDRVFRRNPDGTTSVVEDNLTRDKGKPTDVVDTSKGMSEVAKRPDVGKEVAEERKDPSDPVSDQALEEVLAAESDLDLAEQVHAAALPPAEPAPPPARDTRRPGPRKGRKKS